MEAHPPDAAVGRPWRLIIFMLACAVGVLGLRLLFSPLAGRVGPIGGVSFVSHAYVWTLAGGLLIGHAWTFRLVEPRGWGYAGLGRQAMRPGVVVAGLILGAAAIGIPSLTLLGVGWLQVQHADAGSPGSAALGLAALLLPASLWEELLMRGFFFAVLREVWGPWRAILATSVLFGLMHLQNAEATSQSVAMVALAGVFLGMVLVTTGSLYAAWAAHFAWNFVLAAVLHATLSGLTLPAPGYRMVDAGPDWATGGAWGPEGGFFAAAGMAAGILILYRLRLRRGE